MKKNIYLLFLVLTLSYLKAQITPSITIPNPIPEYDGSYEDFGRHHYFYPNTGEIRLDEEGGLEPTAMDIVSYYTKFCYPQKFILNDNKLAFVYGRVDNNSGADSLHRIDLEMEGSNTTAFPARLDTQQNCKLNYYLPHGTYTDIMGGAAIAVQSIYRNIDMVYTSNNRGLKIYYVVYPGGDPNSVIMKFNGAKHTSIIGTDLNVASNFGDITFVEPKMYQYTYVNNIVTPVNVCPASWQSIGNDRYQITTTSSWNTSLPLIIQVSEGIAVQPTVNGIKWSTYFGGNLPDNIFKCKSDANNNLYVAGKTIASNFPMGIGSNPYNSGFQFTHDAFISKFDSNGQLIWSAFVGSGGSDQINDFDFDVANGGDIYCVGTTAGNVNFPTQTKMGAFSDGPGGGSSDAFIFQLTAAGTASPWRTYVAGTGADVLQACKFDASGNFFVVGYSSSSDISTLIGNTGSYQQSYNPAQQPSAGIDIFDAVILKFSSNTSALNWFTWWGTSGLNNHDAFLGIDVLSNDVYVCGYSDGNSIPDKVNNDFNNSSRDGIIVKFTTSGVASGSRYTNGNKKNNAIKVFNSKVYTCGYGNSAMQPVNSGSYYYNGTAASDDAVFSIYPLNLQSTNHSSFLGGSGSENAIDLDFAPNGVFYITGSTSSSNFPTLNLANTWYSGSNSGNTDYFVSAFVEGYNNLVWSTYLGSADNETMTFPIYPSDGGASIAVDGQGYLHLCGLSDSYTGFPLDNNGGQPTYFQPTRAGAPMSTSDISDGTITRFDLAAVNTFVGLKELKKKSFVVGLYPNPAGSYLVIDNAEFKDMKYEIYNISGQKVMDGRIDREQGNQVDVSVLGSGMYIIRLTSGTQFFSNKFVKMGN